MGASGHDAGRGGVVEIDDSGVSGGRRILVVREGGQFHVETPPVRILVVLHCLDRPRSLPPDDHCAVGVPHGRTKSPVDRVVAVCRGHRGRCGRGHPSLKGAALPLNADAVVHVPVDVDVVHAGGLAVLLLDLLGGHLLMLLL